MLYKRLSVVAALVILGLAACGGTNGPTAYYPTPGAGVPNSAGTSSSFTLTPVDRYRGSLTAVGSGSLQASASTSAPSGPGAVSLARKSAQSNPQQSALQSGDLYITLTAVSNSATVSGISSVSINFPQAPASTPYLGYYNGTAWLPCGGAGTLVTGSQTEYTFSGCTLTPAFSLSSGSSLYLAVYTGTALPTPGPSSAPTPVASPSTVSIEPGASSAITVTTINGVTVSAVSSNTSDVTVSPASQTAGPTGNLTFTVTGVALGSATITFTDQFKQTTTATVSVTNVAPTPQPSPATAIIGLSDTPTITVAAAPNVVITAASQNTAVATVNASSTTNSSGQATFTLDGVSPGATTITFTDPYGDTGVMNVTVSAITNGGFTSGMNGWTACSFTHAPLAAPVDPSGSPLPEATASQKPTTTYTPVPTADLAGLDSATSPPANQNPNYVSATTPPQLGSSVAQLGSLNAATTAYPSGAFGICQTISVPATTATYLSLWAWEGGGEYTFKEADTEADILTAPGGTVDSTLFAEENCFIYPGGNPPSAPGAATTSGCWPAAYGGDSDDYQDWLNGGFWLERGPYDLSAYAGTTVTLFIGNWSYYEDAASTYAQFMFVGNVETTASSTFPTTGPLLAHRSSGVTVHLVRPKAK